MTLALQPIPPFGIAGKTGKPAARAVHGSALLTTVILAGVLSLAISGYLLVTYRTLVTSNRQINFSHSMELAENGMEEGLWGLNNGFDSSWVLTSSNGVTTATKTVGNFVYKGGQEGTGSIAITIQYSPTTAPTISAAGIMTLSDKTVMRRTLYSVCQRVQLFTNALGMRGRVDLGSSPAIVVDSYDSAVGPYDPAAHGYAAVVSGNDISIGNAQIFGYAAYNSTWDYSSSAKVLGPVALNGVNIDPARVSSTAVQPMLDVANVTGSFLKDPVTSSASLTNSLSLPRVGDTSSIYYLDSIDLAGSNELTITAPVILRVGSSVHISGNAQIRVKDTASLQLMIDESYLPTGVDAISLFGNGIVNETLSPEKVSVLVTHVDQDGAPASPPTSSINTATPLYATFYLPNDSVSVPNGMTLFGALVAKNISFGQSGTTAIHYDVSLLRTAVAGFTTPWTLGQLVEK